MTPVRILVADDHEMVRKGLVSILGRSHPEWEIVAEAASGAEAIELAQSLRPDVAILDLSMPGPGGLNVCERLIQLVPGIRILVLTMHAAAPILQRLKKAGVRAYMAKNEAPGMLVLAVERVLAGEPFFASTSALRMAGEIDASEYIPIHFLLTPKELEVTRLLAQGKSNKEVANDLHMSVRTAETHHANILNKLAVDSIGEIVRMAIRDGVI
jgi:DNA-binding NarL/FixJ family response regulator